MKVSWGILLFLSGLVSGFILCKSRVDEIVAMQTTNVGLAAAREFASDSC